MLINIVTVTVLRTGTQFLDILDSTLLVRATEVRQFTGSL